VGYLHFGAQTRPPPPRSPHCIASTVLHFCAASLAVLPPPCCLQLQCSVTAAPLLHLPVRCVALQSFGFFTGQYWIWAGVGAMLAFYFVCNGLTYIGFKWYSGTQEKATVGDRRSRTALPALLLHVGGPYTSGLHASHRANMAAACLHPPPPSLAAYPLQMVDERAVARARAEAEARRAKQAEQVCAAGGRGGGSCFAAPVTPHLRLAVVPHLGLAIGPCLGFAFHPLVPGQGRIKCRQLVSVWQAAPASAVARMLGACPAVLAFS